MGAYSCIGGCAKVKNDYLKEQLLCVKAAF
jgi:hypothetical protein